MSVLESTNDLHVNLMAFESLELRVVRILTAYEKSCEFFK